MRTNSGTVVSCEQPHGILDASRISKMDARGRPASEGTSKSLARGEQPRSPWRAVAGLANSTLPMCNMSRLPEPRNRWFRQPMIVQGSARAIFFFCESERSQFVMYSCVCWRCHGFKKRKDNLSFIKSYTSHCVTSNQVAPCQKKTFTTKLEVDFWGMRLWKL